MIHDFPAYDALECAGRHDVTLPGPVHCSAPLVVTGGGHRPVTSCDQRDA